ncbi:MAG: hypothetical protein JWP01_4087 [Myxococcales bacterium]|nr:hypothetical protein [Myxococcales bacterium]
MSDAKRPGGNRDISDLKARLGLKKGAAAPATGQTRTNGGAGGVQAPPGMNLPPPPGVSQPVPTAPPPPNAEHDPFGAMNHMAAVGQVQRAPEIVIINDGKPVENVGAAGKGSTIAKIVIPAVAALAIGLAIGRISKDANFYNEGLKDAKAILGDPKAKSTVANVKRTLSDLDSTLDDMKTKSNYRPDAAVGTALTKLANELDVKSELVFRAKQNALDTELSGQILSFYAGVAEIKGMIDAHNKAAKFDEMTLKKGKDAQDAATLKEGENAYLAGQLKYGVMLSAPTEEDKAEFGAKLVEIAGVYCGGGANPVAKCGEGESPSGFAYRNEPGGTPIKGDLATGGSDSVPTKKVVMLIQNGIRDAVIKGNEPGVSEFYYTRRIRSIAERTKKLIEDANKLETRLQAESSKGARFSFFL